MIGESAPSENSDLRKKLRKKLREKLIAVRDDIEDRMANNDKLSQVVELDQSRLGRLSRMDAIQMQAVAQEADRRQKLMLKKIAAALTRMDEGVYGNCANCDNPIPHQRLEFDPTVLMCVACAEQAGA